MTGHEHVEGLIAAPYTPFGPDGEVDLDRIDAYAALLARGRLAGAFVCGTTGEGLSLSQAERMAVAERWVRAAPDGLKIIVHVGHNSLAVSRALAGHARDIGAWAVAALSPFFFKPATGAQLAACLGEISAAAPEMPLYYYHIPSMTGVNVRVVDLLEAAADTVPALVGVKYTFEDLMDYALCLRARGGRFDMLFGRDEILLAGLALGARGGVGSTYNYAPRLYTDLMAAFARGDLAAARDLQHVSASIVRVLVAHGGGVRCGKTIMKLIGLDCGPCRAPIVPVGDDEAEAIRAELDAAGWPEYAAT